jgi:hypothetical protein
MKYINSYRLAIIAVAALLAGCGGSQPPIGAPGADGAKSRDRTHCYGLS